MNVLVGDLAEWWPTPYVSVHISFTIILVVLRQKSYDSEMAIKNV